MQQAPQPNHNNRVTFWRNGVKVVARVTTPITHGETVAAVSEDGTVHEVRNDEITRMETGLGIYVKMTDGSYNFSAFCKRPVSRPARRW